MQRSDFCGNLTEQDVNKKVVLNGWIERTRDLGHFIFVQLRDISGIVQVFVDATDSELYKTVKSLPLESCVQIRGVVLSRQPEQVSHNYATGKIEVKAEFCKIFNVCGPLPLDLKQNNSEELRLRYRYLDLRRAEMAQNIKMRAKIMSLVRKYLEAHNFLEIETPILNRSTPEGASDYLVPSRVHKGKFYALPQSPQLFKQLLMVAGFERYFQIVKCLRDEDLRSDRQPEFTQIDLEASFLEPEALQEIVENLVKMLWKECLAVDLATFPKMTWREAMTDFGSDKPDLRNPLKLIDVADLVSEIPFFAEFANDQGRVIALKITNGASFTRKQIDDYTKFVVAQGAGGLAWLKINTQNQGVAGAQGSIAKFVSEQMLTNLVQRLHLKDGDLVFFMANEWVSASNLMGNLRQKLGADLGLIDQETFKPLWVVDFPMFEVNDQGRLSAAHHPFTSPKETDLERLAAAPLKAVAKAYDMVINGYEVGGGSVRITDNQTQQKVFEILKIEPQEQQEKFGFLLDALKLGAPPHLGLAFGLDRLTMLICGTDNIKDVIAFPKTNTAACLLTKAPSQIEDSILAELAIKSVV